MAETNGLSLWILCLILQLVLSSASTPTPCPKVVDHKYFNCSHHSLEEVPKGLPSTLEVIVLSHNRIRKLDDDSFQGLHNLVQIDVSYNSISKISTAAFNHLTKLETLILRKNQLHEAESAYRNKPILSFHPQDLNCDHKIPLYIWIVIGTGLILTIIITIAIVKKRYYIKYLYYVVRAHTKGYQPLDNEDNNYVYDAFVSHSSEDEKWVKDMREKLEKENGFKLCFHKRDFDIGKPIATNIIESIDASRHTICVITEAFLDSGWCKYELQFALSRLFKERKEVIILIFLQKIPDQLLTDQLKVHRLIRRFIKDNTYIEWPHNPDEELAFWEKLKDSLR
ncbi:toll-like receptor 2 type-2 [Anneissia japonica]|uniref:toll-like receptor 2 type-2 n=1 Tax=Anneissia japonica TaxID=1529436 RepID=UPI0014258BA6|nr:toll-like receptor 2 type-2 [Anneissia japonica]